MKKHITNKQPIPVEMREDYRIQGNGIDVQKAAESLCGLKSGRANSPGYNKFHISGLVRNPALVSSAYNVCLTLSEEDGNSLSSVRARGKARGGGQVTQRKVAAKRFDFRDVVVTIDFGQLLCVSTPFRATSHIRNFACRFHVSSTANEAR